MSGDKMTKSIKYLKFNQGNIYENSKESLYLY